MSRSILPVVLLLWALPSFAAVTFDNSGSARTASGTSGTFSFAVAANANRCMIGMISDPSNAITGAAMTWDNGGTNQSLTLITNNGGGGSGAVWLFKLIAPTTGTKTMSVSWTGTTALDIAAAVFDGADQSTCINAPDTTGVNQAPPATLTVTSTTTGATLVCVANITSISAITGGTSIYLDSGVGAAGYILGGTSNVHSWTVTGTSQLTGIHILAAAAGGATAHRTTLLGVGK